MSSIQSQDDGPVCILCFWGKRECKEERTCCSGAYPNQCVIDASLRIGEGALESSVIERLRNQSRAQQIRLAQAMNSEYILECQSRSELKIGAPYSFTIRGATNVSNDDLVTELDSMILKTFAPSIQATDTAANSVSSACLGIGYCNMLIFAQLQDNSEPHNKHDLSPILAELAIMRIDSLIAKLMSPVRYARLELDAETRPGLVLWYFYLSTICKELPKMGRCQMFGDLELCQHVQKISISFREELTKRFATDCKNKAHWASGLASQRGLKKKICDLRFWTLFLNLKPFNSGGTEAYGSQLPPNCSISSHLNNNRPSWRSNAGLITMSQLSTEATHGDSAFGVTSNANSKWNDTMDDSHNLGDESCKMGKAREISIYDDVANNISNGASLFQGSTNSPLAMSRSHSRELEWEDNSTNLNNTSDGYGSQNYVMFTSEPHIQLSNPIHNKPLHIREDNNQSQLYQTNNQLDEYSNALFSITWNDSDTYMSPLERSNLMYNTSPLFYSNTNETPDQNHDDMITMPYS